VTISRWILPTMWMYSDEWCEECEIIILCTIIFSNIAPFVRSWDKTWRSRPCHSRHRGTCPLYGYKHTLRIHISTSGRQRLRNVQFYVQCFVVCYYSNMTGKYVKCLFGSSEWRIVTWGSIYI
jgi:hypothetical protein